MQHGERRICTYFVHIKSRLHGSWSPAVRLGPRQLVPHPHNRALNVVSAVGLRGRLPGCLLLEAALLLIDSRKSAAQINRPIACLGGCNLVTPVVEDLKVTGGTLLLERFELRDTDPVDAVGWARIDGLDNDVGRLTALLHHTRHARLVFHAEGAASDGSAVAAANTFGLVNISELRCVRVVAENWRPDARRLVAREQFGRADGPNQCVALIHVRLDGFHAVLPRAAWWCRIECIESILARCFLLLQRGLQRADSFCHVRHKIISRLLVHEDDGASWREEEGPTQ